MVSIPKIVGVLSCSFVLCLSLSNTSQAEEGIRTEPCADRKGQPNLVKCTEEMRQGNETIKGEVLRIQGDNLVVQRFNGKEVRLHTDQSTLKTGNIRQGDRIEAKVNDERDLNDEKHVLSIRQLEK